jgi:hypothetical protein
MERVGVAAPAEDLPDAVRRLGGMKIGFSGGPDRAGNVEVIATVHTRTNCVLLKLHLKRKFQI